ncbi:MAG: LysR family transcriptional regulator [Bacteroidales bacterium]|nr:LysR family transcriptional regulator [Bacteroidales bacterium]
MLEDFRLKVFETVARKGSFTLAARELGVSQPAVSQNIADLEKELGRTLLVRKRGEVALTQEGQVFHEYALKILGWYSSVQASFRDGNAVRKPAVRIGCDNMAARLVLPALISVIRGVDPGIEITVLPENAPDPDIRLSFSVPDGGREGVNSSGPSRPLSFNAALSFVPSDTFASDPLCRLLRNTIEEYLLG